MKNKKLLRILNEFIQLFLVIINLISLAGQMIPGSTRSKSTLGNELDILLSLSYLL